MHAKRFKKTRGAIAAGHAMTAGAGCHALREGGNAVDAAVAASFMSYVAEPSLTTIAGGGFMMVHSGEKQQSWLLDFFSEMPGRGKGRFKTEELDFYAVHLDFGGTLQEFHIGRGSAGIPGNVHGLLTAHQRFGQLPLQVVMEPAIKAAREGVTITKNQAFVMTVVRGCVMATASTRALYAPQGHLIEEGEAFRNPDLAGTMEALARNDKKGIELFYQGDIAHKIAHEIGEKGGLITRQDLAQYETIIRKPLAVHYRGIDMVTNPPPSLGGALIAFSLQLLESVKFPPKISGHSPQFASVLLEVMRLTNEARSRHEKLTAREVKIYQDLLKQHLARPPEPSEAWQTGSFGSMRWPLGNTTHISVIDEAHNAASVTTSHGEGNGVCVPSTGIVLNNLLGEEDINPQGFHQWEPGTRLPSMMAPTILLRQKNPILVMGSAGSNRLRTAIVQTIAKIIDGKMTINRAVNGPRIHWERGRLDVEPGLPKQTLKALEKREPHQVHWKENNLFFGGLHAVMRRPGGKGFTGAGDLRRGGVVKIV